jgi:hypothetical protein
MEVLTSFRKFADKFRNVFITGISRSGKTDLIKDFVSQDYTFSETRQHFYWDLNQNENFKGLEAFVDSLYLRAKNPKTNIKGLEQNLQSVLDETPENMTTTIILDNWDTNISRSVIDGGLAVQIVERLCSSTIAGHNNQKFATVLVSEQSSMGLFLSLYNSPHSDTPELRRISGLIERHFRQFQMPHADASQALSFATGPQCNLNEPLASQVLSMTGGWLHLVSAAAMLLHSEKLTMDELNVRLTWESRARLQSVPVRATEIINQLSARDAWRNIYESGALRFDRYGLPRSFDDPNALPSAFTEGMFDFI